jgi:hypothetical protein
MAYYHLTDMGGRGRDENNREEKDRGKRKRERYGVIS